MSRGVLEAISKSEGKEVKSIDFFIVVNNGAINNSFDNEDLADKYIDNINESCVDSLNEESDDNDMLDFGFNDPYKVHIKLNKELALTESLTTENNDIISYRDIAASYINRQKEEDLLSGLDDIDIDMSDDDN